MTNRQTLQRAVEALGRLLFALEHRRDVFIERYGAERLDEHESTLQWLLGVWSSGLELSDEELDRLVDSERPLDPAVEYRCEVCRWIYFKGRTDTEANAECRETFGDLPSEDLCLICDDCFQRLNPAHYPELVRLVREHYGT